MHTTLKTSNKKAHILAMWHNGDFVMERVKKEIKNLLLKFFEYE